MHLGVEVTETSTLNLVPIKQHHLSLCVYCKTGKPPRALLVAFCMASNHGGSTKYSNSRSKIKLRRNRVKNTPDVLLQRDIAHKHVRIYI